MSHADEQGRLYGSQMLKQDFCIVRRDIHHNCKKYYSQIYIYIFYRYSYIVWYRIIHFLSLLQGRGSYIRAGDFDANGRIDIVCKTETGIETKIWLQGFHEGI